MTELSPIRKRALELQAQYAQDVASGLLARGHFRYTDKNGNSVTDEEAPVEGLVFRTHYRGKEDRSARYYFTQF